MEKDTKTIKQEFLREITAQALEDLETRYLGRKGIVNMLLKEIKGIPEKDRRAFGQSINALKAFIEQALTEKREEEGKRKAQRNVDFTVPAKKIHRGHLHPLTLIQEEMMRTFYGLNFSIVEGPEVETEFYNFDALNMPPHHPARDLWDTFWLKPTNDQLQTTHDEKQTKEHANGRRSSVVGRNLLLRTHTSPMQVRYMETHEPPLRIIVPGKVFRYEASDATHDIQFYQLEGLFVDRYVSVANFKGVIEVFFKKLFKEEFGGLRLRPAYFPFTEPSFEVDFYWKSKAVWLEIMGAGMVHPNVFKAAGFASGEWQGFAFGLGIDRVAMLKYKIPDIRMFYSGDLRVIGQF